MSSSNCEICTKVPFKYTCPKCNVQYCSVDCYKSPAHLRCSEEFYKTCIQEELNVSHTSNGDVRKMYEILQRLRESDAGIQPEDFDETESDFEGPIDSDDDDPCDNADDDDCLATRLQGININDANEVWQRLNASEKEEFKNLVQTGDIMKYLPDYKPWWIKESRTQSKVTELQGNVNEKSNIKANETISNIPTIVSNIPHLHDICKKTPSPSVHYNLWNILTAYACVVRHSAGEHLTNPSAAIAQLVNLSTTLKYGTNFEEVEDAIISVEMESLTSHDRSGAIAPVILVESRELLTKDAYDLMFTQTTKLAALSDILNLFQLAKRDMSKSKTDSATKSHTAEFQKLFSLCNGSTEIDRNKIRQLMKKIEFFLSFVQEQND